ncbi:MAG: hypothetical protein SFV81_08275 [Pirellulaceae bacterium]|nr:hypothetical protein [Pirellulaceae bacterium]
MSSKLESRTWWLASGFPIPNTFLQGLGTEDEMKQLLKTAEATSAGLIVSKRQTPVDESLLSDLIAYIDKWFEVDPFDGNSLSKQVVLKQHLWTFQSAGPVFWSADVLDR